VKDPIGSIVDSVVSLGKQESSTFSVAVVDGVTQGASPQGFATVTIAWQGASGLPVSAYLASYTPVVGHVVLIARSTVQTVILGRLLTGYAA